MIDLDPTGLRARLRAARAANPVPHSYDHLRDPGLLQRLLGTEIVEISSDISTRPEAPTIEAVVDDGVEEAQPEPVKRTRKRKPTLPVVHRQAARAGIAVARYKLHPDGTIDIVIGKPSGEIEVDDGPNSWSRVQ